MKITRILAYRVELPLILRLRASMQFDRGRLHKAVLVTKYR